MPTPRRFLAATSVVCFALLTPVAVSASPAEPPAEPPVEQPWPPASTHGAFRALPASFSDPWTFPACGSEVTRSIGDIDTTQYRALVTTEGDTVVEYRGVVTVDITRASDGARLEEAALAESGFETYSADGRSVTYDWPGTWLVVAFDEVEAAAFAAAPEHGEEMPPVTSVQIIENSTEYVFDLCDLLDKAAKTTTEEAASGTPAS